MRIWKSGKIWACCNVPGLQIRRTCGILSLGKTNYLNKKKG